MTMFDADQHATIPGEADGLSSFFESTGIAIVGASNEPSRVGGRVLLGLQQQGFAGAIYPVHPKHSEISGFAAYSSVADIPDPVDLAVVCLGADKVAETIRQCGARGIKSAVVFADGFTEEMTADLHAALAEARAKCGLRMIGPNTVGIRTMHSGVMATFAADLNTPLRGGEIATIAQSGGLGVYFGSAQFMKRGYGASHVIDTGGEYDVTAAECLEYLVSTPVKAIALVLEGARDGRRLCAAVQAATIAGKTVAFLKAGRSVAGEAQIKSHTGALAGRSAVFEAAMRNSGAIIASDERDLLDIMTMAAADTVPKGRRVGIVTPSGGFGILALDAAEDFHLTVPPPERPANARERAELAHGHFSNPLDFSSTISAGPNAVQTSLTWMASQLNIDVVVMWQAYGAVRQDRQDMIFRAISGTRQHTDTPIFVCGLTTPEFEEKLRSIGVLWFEEPTRLMRAISLVAPRQAVEPTSQPQPKIAAESDGPVNVLSGIEAREALAGIVALPLSRGITVTTLEQIEELLADNEGHGILKVEAPGIAHKSELGFVSGPINQSTANEAFLRLVNARELANCAAAPIEFQKLESGVEVALGGFFDPTFGPSVMVATGGIFLEVLKDAAFSPAPVTHAIAMEMISSLKGVALLKGERGKPLADVGALAEAIVGLSEFVAENPQFAQVDVNPVMVMPAGRGIIAVDVAIYLDKGE